MFIAINTLARFIVTNYWAFVLSSLVFFSIAVHYYNFYGGPIEFSYYVLYLVVGGLTRHLLLSKIPSTFLTLRDTGAFKEGTLERLPNSLVRRLERPLGYFLGIVLTIFILYFYRFYNWHTWQAIYSMGFSTALLVINVTIIIDLLLAYAGGVAICMVAITAWEFYYLGRTGELHIQPFHPDRCAGLASIGQLFFFSSLTLVVIALFFGGWLLFGGWFLSGKWNPDFASSYNGFQPWFTGTLVGVGLVSVAVFFLPLLSIHGMMKAEASRYKRKALPFVAQISDLDASLVASASSENYDELDTRLTQIKSLRNAYMEYQNIPTWPVDFQTRWQFFAAQLAVWISVITLADKIKTLVVH
jgi:hypothetical protein